MPEQPDARIESYILLGDQRIPAQIEYAPIIEESHTYDFNRSLTDLRNTTFQTTGTLTEEGMRVLGDLLWDHTPASLYYPNMSEAPIHVSIDTSGLKHALKQLKQIRSSLVHLGTIYHRAKLRKHKEKLRQRRKHRAMFRRKKRGLA